MPTITSNLLVSLVTDQSRTRIFEGRIGVSNTTIQQGSIVTTLGPDEILLDKINSFCLIECGAPFWITITDLDLNTTRSYVKGLFLAYLEATSILIEWDSVLAKESQVSAYWS